MLTVEEVGWEAVRRATFARDGGCVATQYRIFGRDTAPDSCQNGFGTVVNPNLYSSLEWDHVKQEGVRYDDEAHGVMVCPWHHRLSQRWRSDTKPHREALRTWLALHWPEVWM